jgi:hypothetical protein
MKVQWFNAIGAPYRSTSQQGENQRALEHAASALNLYRTLDQPVWLADALNLEFGQSKGW